MSIIVDPSKILKRVAPGRKIEKLVSKRLTLKKAALSFTEAFDFLDRKSIEKVALKTLKGYAQRVKDDPDLKGELSADPAQLIQRVQNEVVFQVSSEIRERYAGEFYKWLPSDAEEPDPEHQLNYGKVFQVGEGEMPGERIGCRCGMEILVDDKSLNL